MVPLHLSAQRTDEDHGSAPTDMEYGNRFVSQMFTDIEKLRKERDYLRSALVDAGFSLRVETIAHCADRSR